LNAGTLDLLAASFNFKESLQGAIVGYWSRVRSRAWKETKGIWTAYRWWLAVSGFAGATVLLGVRGGWRAIMNATDTIINGCFGAALAFVGTYIISIVRSFKLLDDDRATETANVTQAYQATVNRQSASIQELEQKAALPLVSPQERANRKTTREATTGASEAELKVLRYILESGGVDLTSLYRAFAGQGHLLESSLKKWDHILIQKRVDPQRTQTMISIIPGFKDALSHVIYES
jgi:hypothetical protein